MKHLTELKEKLAEIDQQIPEILKLSKTKKEQSAAQIALDVLKLDSIDNFILGKCQDAEVLEAYNIYAQIARENIKKLMEFL